MNITSKLITAFLQGWTGAFGPGVTALYGISAGLPAQLPHVTLPMWGCVAVASVGAGVTAVHNRLMQSPSQGAQ